MHGDTRHAFRTSGILLCVLLFVVGGCALGAVPGRGGATNVHPTALSFAASSAPPNNTTVDNAVTVSSSSISLSSPLEARGLVMYGTQPLSNAGVALHMGDAVVASTHTDSTGAYAFSAPVGVLYFVAALSGGASVYSVVTTADGTSVYAPSAVTTVAVDAFPFYAMLVAIIGAVLVGLYLYARRGRGNAPRPAETAPVPAPSAERRVLAEEKIAPTTSARPSTSEQLRAYGVAVSLDNLAQPSPHPEHESPEEVTSPASEPASLSEQSHVGAQAASHSAADGRPSEHPADSSDVKTPPVAADAVFAHGRDLFTQGRDCEAVNALYDAIVSALVDTGGVTLAPAMTLREKYIAITTAMPDVRKPLWQLTLACELRSYGGKSLTKERQDAALEAFRSIMQQLTNA